jgi:hypothetical protein
MTLVDDALSIIIDDVPWGQVPFVQPENYSTRDFMADRDHIAQLRKDVTAWNAWRAEDPTFIPDLSGADLTRTDLWGANLTEANLQRGGPRDCHPDRYEPYGR